MDTVIRTARAGEEAALAALWNAAFDGQLTPVQWLLDDARRAHTHVAVESDGTLSGAIWGLPKRLRESDGGVAAVHCIGSVAVAAQARGRGLARRLVAATLASADADWALLFTGTPHVYRSSGFETFQMPRNRTGPWAPSASARGDDGGDVHVTRTPIGPGRLDVVHEIYERSRAGLVLAPLRGDRDWTMAEVRLAGGTLHLARRDGTVLGYAVTLPGEGTGVLAEIAVAPAPDEAWAALLADIGDGWDAIGIRSCDLAVPDTDAAARQLASFAPEAMYHPDSTGMTRPLRRAPLIDGIRHFTAADYF